MKSIFESVIRQGGYDLSDMLGKIDQYHIAGKLTDQERDELYAKARSGADPGGNLDLLGKVMELEAQVRLLVEKVAALENAGVPLEPAPPEEYAPGKWYYTGDLVRFKGRTHKCIAPKGQVCTWSPDEYPAYWEVVA